ncbi:hypothetical protein PVAP13_2NG170000 [Panicum virgatum]|uniref:Alkyl transferase n=1 Tax=Panicum virgatum TaxID=38727 RepID=A0A8T0VLQ7_PANVG|nr:hypothetical protein PVAP13_2NG170000 [Panicum virgatum]
MDYFQAQVENLMWCCERFIGDNIDNFSRQGIRLQVVGDTSRMSGSLRRAAAEADEATRHNSQLHVMLGFCYSGKWDIAQACQELARAARANELSPDDIDESLLASRLATSVAGEFSADADLVIRTGGELRLSNFPLWQVAYAEFFFTDKAWPDFGEADYLEVLRSFQSRDRRFGL